MYFTKLRMFNKKVNIRKISKLILCFVLAIICLLSSSCSKVSNEFEEQRKLGIKLVDQIIKDNYLRTSESFEIAQELHEKVNLHSMNAHRPRTDEEYFIQENTRRLRTIYYQLPASRKWIGTIYDSLYVSEYTKQEIRNIRDALKLK